MGKLFTDVELTPNIFFAINIAPSTLILVEEKKSFVQKAEGIVKKHTVRS